MNYYNYKKNSTGDFSVIMRNAKVVIQFDQKME